MSKLLDSIRAAAAARQALNADKSASAADGGAVRGAAEGDDSPLMMAMRRADALNGDAASAVKTQADVQRETDRARNAIGAAQTREAIERGEAAAAKRRAAAEEAARQLARDRIEAEKSAEAAALARIAAEEQATRAAAERANSEREAAAAAQRKADAERAALNAAQQRAQAEEEAAQAATARAGAEAVLQREIEARLEAEKAAAAREHARRQAEEEAARAAAARAALEAQRVAAADAGAPQNTPARSSNVGAQVKALMSRHGEMLAGAAAVLLIGIAIGDWAGRNAVIEAKTAARMTQEAADVQLRVDADVDAFNQRLAARKPNAQAALRKKATAERKQ